MTNTKPKPFIAPGSDTPVTPQEIAKREIRIKKLEQIGEHPTRVTEDEFENPYKLKVIALISEDKEIPEELLKQMEAFEVAHQSSR